MRVAARDGGFGLRPGRLEDAENSVIADWLVRLANKQRD